MKRLHALILQNVLTTVRNLYDLRAICTRRCPFCDVAHGRPNAPDPQEPIKLAQTIKDMGLRYVVITSVDRDDLRDGGAQHFADCITAIREKILIFASKL